MGTAAIGLVRVADGVADLYYERHLFGWDMLAGALIAAESGARVYLPPIEVATCVAGDGLASFEPSDWPLVRGADAWGQACSRC